MSLAAFLQAAANVARIVEEPELQEQFKKLLATRGKAYASRWIEENGAAAGLDAATIASIKAKLQ
jgi:hypothetical protein